MKELRKGVLKIWSKFTGEKPCRSVISIKLHSNFTEIILRHGCSPVNLSNFIEITRRYGCSPVNLLHICRIPFPKDTSGWLLLNIQQQKIRFEENLEQNLRQHGQQFENWLYKYKINKFLRFYFHKLFLWFSKLLRSTNFYLWVLRAQFGQFGREPGRPYPWTPPLDARLNIYPNFWEWVLIKTQISEMRIHFFISNFFYKQLALRWQIA